MNKTINIIGTIILALCFCFSCNSKKKDETEQKFNFSSIKIERYRVFNANLDSIQLSSYIVKRFNSEGKEENSIYFTNKDSVMMKFENTYTNGQKTRINWRNKKNKIVRYVDMTYDSDDNIIQSKSYKPDGEFIEGYMHRWKNNNKTEEKGPITDSIFQPNSIYTYTDFGEFETLVEYDLENDSLYGTFLWKYTDFDAHNEWLEREVYFNDKLTRLERRQIKYIDN